MHRPMYVCTATAEEKGRQRQRPTCSWRGGPWSSPAAGIVGARQALEQPPAGTRRALATNTNAVAHADLYVDSGPAPPSPPTRDSATHYLPLSISISPPGGGGAATSTGSTNSVISTQHRRQPLSHNREPSATEGLATRRRAPQL
jgi:hypothetical protein